MKALLGYSYGNLDDMREMILHPNAVLGLSDGGAHCGAICDASIPTFMLTHWARDRDRGERLPLELVVQKQTRDTAAALRPRRPRRGRAGLPGRPQRDRLRRVVARRCPSSCTTCPVARAA